MAKRKDSIRKNINRAAIYAGIVTGLALALTELRDVVQDFFHIPEQWSRIVGLSLATIFVYCFFVHRKLVRWWSSRFRNTGVLSQSFRLRPLDSQDHEGFVREDDAHFRILTWLRQTNDRLLYLTGASGSGKSSLLNAYVLPELREQDNAECIVVQGVREPLAQVRRALLEPQRIWQQPKHNSEESVADLTLRAAAHLSGNGRQLIIVFDQFEELLILHERGSAEVAGVLDFVKATTDVAAPSAPKLLLVMRSDYEGRVRELELPPERVGENKETVPRLTEDAANQFLERAGITSPPLRQRLVREAASLEESGGRLRYISLNFLGSAAQHNARLGHGYRRAGRLLRDTVRAWVTEPEVREESAPVLRSMISDEETKKPVSLDELTQSCGLSLREVERVLRHFEQDGLVRRYQTDREIWEISHDFVARLLQRVLDELKGSLWHRLRGWLPATTCLVLLLTTVVTLAPMGLDRYRTYEVWKLAQPQFEPAAADTLILSFASRGQVGDETLAYLKYHPNRKKISKVILEYSSITSGKSLQVLEKLPALQALDLSSCGGLTSLEGFPDNLPALSSIDLSYCNGLTSLEGFPDNLPALSSIDLSDCDGLSSFEGFPDNLPALSSLDLSACSRLKSLEGLPASLPSLSEIDLSDSKWRIHGDDRSFSLEGFPENLPSLLTLDLSGCWTLKNLTGLPENLPALLTLDLSDCDGLENLTGLPENLPSLLTLDLSYCDGLENLTGFPQSLPSLLTLDLSYCDLLGNLTGLPESFPALLTLNLRDCDGLENLTGFPEKLPSLLMLNLRDCNGLKNLTGFPEHLPALFSIDLRDCYGLEDLTGLSKNLPSLSILNMSNCDLKSLLGLPATLPMLSRLELNSCSRLFSLKGLPASLPELSILDLGYGPKMTMRRGKFMSLKEMPQSLPKLSWLSLNRCESLEGLPHNLASLSSLKVSNCESLKGLPNTLPQLRLIDVSECYGLNSFEGLPGSLPSLETILIGQRESSDSAYRAQFELSILDLLRDVRVFNDQGKTPRLHEIVGSTMPDGFAFREDVEFVDADDFERNDPLWRFDWFD